jgi:hypothetical protein
MTMTIMTTMTIIIAFLLMHRSLFIHCTTGR